MRRFLALAMLALMARLSWGQEPPAVDAPPPSPLVIMAPLPDSTVSGEEPLEVSVLLSGAGGVSISLLLDGADVTSGADVTGDYVFYLSPSPPPAGPHTLQLIGAFEGDTVFSESWSFSAAPAAPAAWPEAMPWDLTIGLGWQYGTCDRDTAGLGLSVPVGHLPSGEANFYGPLWGGLVQGDLSYEPAYDADPHGLLQLNRRGLDLSLGEFYPDFSSLAFADAIPLGLLGRASAGRLTLDFTACRTASADTALSSFAQYLYGGRAAVSLGESLRVGLGYLQGHDQPSSLPDSVRFRATPLVTADTIYGLTDTILYVDSLHPVGNRIGWLSARKVLGSYSLDLEAAGTATTTDDGQRDQGRGFLARLARCSQDLDASLAFSSTDAGFRSFGSPYLETAKDELEGYLQAGWPGSARTSLQASLYKAYADSSDGLGWSAGAGLALGAGPLTTLYFRSEYSARPYQGYLYQNRSLSVGLGLSLCGIKFGAGYGYNSSSSPVTTQSHNASADVSRKLYRRLATASAGLQYYQVRDAGGSSDRDKTTLTSSLSGDLSAALGYQLQARRIDQTDRIDPGQSYRQEVVSASLSVRF